MTRHLVILASIICATAAFAQNPKVDCGDECAKMKFPYRFCDTEGRSLFLCTDNPNNEPGLRPFKQRLPLRACGFKLDMFGEDYPYKMVFYPPSDPRNPTGALLFNAHNVQSKLELALDSWNRLCPPQGPDHEHQDCCLRVRWSQVLGEFGDNPMQFAFTRIRSMPYIGPAKDHTCLFDCSISEMILNRQPEFIQPDEDGLPRHYFVTERDNFAYLPAHEGPGRIWVDMQSLLEHELGHWLGFHHANERDGYGVICGAEGSIMLSGETGILNNRIATITPADECMFKKLYCCKETKRIVWVDDPHAPPDDYPNHTKERVKNEMLNNGNSGFTVSPNPAANGTITLSFYGNSMPGEASLRIIDAAGNGVSLQRVEAAEKEASVDVSGLPSGIYMIQLVQYGKTFGRKFIITD